MGLVMAKTIIEDWDGPVCVNDRYFDDLDSAVEWYWDDVFNVHENKALMEDVPEFVECCDEQKAHLDADSVIESMDNWDENCHSDDNYASNDVTDEQRKELQVFLDGWLERLKWRCWMGNNKYIHLRPLVEEYQKVIDHRDRMVQAMDYADS